MDMMSGIAATAMSLNNAQFAQQYSTSVMKKVMNTQELAGQELLRMLPQQPQYPKGQYIDIYV